MIFDSLDSMKRYMGLNKNLDRAIEFMEKNPPYALPIGRTEFDGDTIYCNVSVPELQPYANTQWEAHENYIDIQVAVSGGETIHYAPLCDVKDWEKYDEAHDIRFSHVSFAGEPIFMRAHNVCIFFPWDAHRPCVGTGTCKKAVIKVKI